MFFEAARNESNKTLRHVCDVRPIIQKEAACLLNKTREFASIFSCSHDQQRIPSSIIFLFTKRFD